MKVLREITELRDLQNDSSSQKAAPFDIDGTASYFFDITLSGASTTPIAFYEPLETARDPRFDGPRTIADLL